MWFDSLLKIYKVCIQSRGKILDTLQALRMVSHSISIATTHTIHHNKKNCVPPKSWETYCIPFQNPSTNFLFVPQFESNNHSMIQRLNHLGHIAGWITSWYFIAQMLQIHQSWVLAHHELYDWQHCLTKLGFFCFLLPSSCFQPSANL